MNDNISIVGIGRLGLCTALCLEHVGYHVVGIDVSAEYVNSINTKTLKSTEPEVEKYLQKSKNFVASTDVKDALTHSNLILIFVATPSTPGPKAYDHSTLSKVLSKINEYKVENKHIVIGCTIIPGYIRQVGRFLLQDCKNTTLSYNPEFIAQGKIIQDTFNPDMVLVGEGNIEAGDLLEKMHRKLAPNSKICRMSPDSAEITKLGVNCFVTTKIAFANMIGDIADRTPGAEKTDILRAIGSDSRVGTKYLSAGFGFGGPCFPRDNRAIGYYANSVGVKPIIPEATDASNKLHTQLQIERLLSEDPPQRIVFEDIGYKCPCPVPIIEESQKLAIAEAAARRGYDVIIRDYKHLVEEVQKEYGNLFSYDIKTE